MMSTYLRVRQDGIVFPLRLNITRSIYLHHDSDSSSHLLAEQSTVPTALVTSFRIPMRLGGTVRWPEAASALETLLRWHLRHVSHPALWKPQRIQLLGLVYRLQ